MKSLIKIWVLLGEYRRQAFSAVRSYKLRSSITIFIIAIGILSLVGTLTVVEAINHTFSKNLEAIGAKSFFIRRYKNNLFERGHRRLFRRSPNPPITYKEAMMFKKKFRFDGALTAISFTGTSQAELSREEKKTGENVRILGADENYLPAYQLDPGKGRNFSAREVIEGRNLAIIGPDVAKNLFDKDENPINQYIFYKGYRLKVIGVTRPKGTTFGESQDNFVVLPITLARKIFSGRNKMYEIRVFVSRPGDYEKAKDKAIVVMRNIRKLKPFRENNFGIVGTEEAMSELKQTTSVLRSAAFVIGLITILASSIALMNIMLVTVTERIREIGLRKAIGASSGAILWQFFIETLFIALMGAVLGIILGVLFGYGIARLFRVDFVMPWNAIMWGLIITFITAFFSGLYPAYKASQASPIEALRYE